MEDIIEELLDLKEENKSILDQWNTSKKTAQQLITYLTDQNTNLSKQVEETMDAKNSLQAKVTELETKITSLNKELELKERDLIECIEIININNKDIRKLKDKIAELQPIKKDENKGEITLGVISEDALKSNSGTINYCYNTEPEELKLRKDLDLTYNFLETKLRDYQQARK